MLKKYIIIATVFTTSFYTLYSQADTSLWNFFRGNSGGVAPVKNQLYLEECSECHFPYQPGLLPIKSWVKVMDKKALENHFEDNAELEETIRVQLLSYLVKNAADNSNYKRSVKIMKSLNGQSPLRTTDTPYIYRKHDKIPKKLIAQKEVGSISNCQICHKNASKGSYDDDDVNIPNAVKSQYNK